MLGIRRLFQSIENSATAFHSFPDNIKLVLLIAAIFGSFIMPINGGVTGATVYAADISTCTVIDAPGTYRLTANIQESTAVKCIEIVSSNVVLDGGNHSISGKQTANTYGIHVYNPSQVLTNIVLRNLSLKDWHVGIYLQNVDDSTIEGSTINQNEYCGVHLAGCDRNTIDNCTLNTNNFFGVILNGGSANNTISASTVNDQGQGIQVGLNNSLANHTIIRNNNIGGNKNGIDVAGSDYLRSRTTRLHITGTEST
ncbi:MAG TPA: right-handed parallel beta-helix repeat-containing protein [Desulfobacterales bacterium]